MWSGRGGIWAEMYLRKSGREKWRKALFYVSLFRKIASSIQINKLYSWILRWYLLHNEKQVLVLAVDGGFRLSVGGDKEFSLVHVWK